MAHWTSNIDSGILRKNKPKENHVDLLVFGYACKLFRDDEKALYIDKGKHLIPWMADDNLKIDRYDCRGALSDLSLYEASREGFDAMRWLGLSESERKLEQLCDSERYYSLHINEEEEEMYKEEEQKRLKTNEFQYSYDVPTDPDAKIMISTVPEAEEEDVEYVPAPNLDVPVDITIPKTVKENTRIEKTALFVCKQGPQMEILIKAKQGDNPQFAFLNQGDPLYKYYRHVLSAIKTGRYQVSPKNKTDEFQDKSLDSNTTTATTTINDDHYLHPSLISTTTAQSDVQASSIIPTIPYKPSANCAYSQLVNRIQQGGASSNNQNDTTQQQQQHLQQQSGEGLKSQEISQMSYEQQQQYYQYYYAVQYYEYYKQLAQYQQSSNSNQVQLQPPETNLDSNIQNYIQQIAYAHYLQSSNHQSTTNSNSYAQIVSNMNKDVSNPYSALLANIQQQQQNVNEQQQQQQQQQEITSSETATTTNEKVVKKKPGLLNLAQYGSDSEEDDDDNDMEQNDLPTDENQVVIDKMAIYVAKNGEQFEEIVKAKGDPRFEFLNETHQYHRYYRNKIKEYKIINETKVIEIDQNIGKVVKEKKVIAPVSFSIKKPKDDAPKEIKNALPMEESDEDDDGSNQSEQTTTTTTSVQVEPTSKDIESITNETSNESNQHHKNGIFDADDPILEMIDLTDDVEERKDAKRAEDKIKDKLAAAAREKLASVARDRALQLERKKKAAAFLKLKSSEEELTSQTKEQQQTEKLSLEDVEEKKSCKLSTTTSTDGGGDNDVVQIGDSDSDEREIVMNSSRRKSSKKKKSHKRKHSKSKHDSRRRSSSNSSRSKKKSKKKRRRSESCSSTDSKYS